MELVRKPYVNPTKVQALDRSLDTLDKCVGNGWTHWTTGKTTGKTTGGDNRGRQQGETTVVSSSAAMYDGEPFYTAFATLEVWTSDTSFPFSRCSCLICSFKAPIVSACSVIFARSLSIVASEAPWGTPGEL